MVFTVAMMLYGIYHKLVFWLLEIVALADPYCYTLWSLGLRKTVAISHTHKIDCVLGSFVEVNICARETDPNQLFQIIVKYIYIFSDPRVFLNLNFGLFDLILI